MSWKLEPRDSVRFARNPLVTVIAQLRFHPILKVGQATAEFQDRVRSRFPLFEERTVHEVGLDTATGQVETRDHKQYLFKVADQSVVIALAPDSVAIETTSYSHHTSFLGDVQTCLTALQSTFAPVVPTRLGLRYVNDVDRPRLCRELDREVRWEEVVDRQLLVLPQVLTLANTAYYVEITSSLALGHMTLRHGMLADPRDHYRIDIDRYLNATFDVGDTQRLLERFAGDSYSLFSGLIGPALHDWMQLAPSIVGGGTH